jgi:hypothetical protein
MKQFIFTTILIILINNALAQTIGNVGINTTTPKAMLHVKDSSVLFSGGAILPIQPGKPPEEGQGIYLMWYPDKAAFRAGFSYGNFGNKANIGNYSFAGGASNLASGTASFAMGNFSAAMGEYSTALGANTFANGSFSSVLGRENISNGFAGTVLGMYNQPILSIGQNGVTGNTPLLIVGNGDDNANRRNALTITKNGLVGIGVNGLPQYGLHVANNEPGNNDGNFWGLVVENTNTVNTGQAAINFMNRGTNGTNAKFWANGLNEGRNLAWTYGTSFDNANTKFVFDSVGRFGIGTLQPNSSALLEINSINKGFLLPRMTSINKTNIGLPATGLMVYDTDVKRPSYFDGTKWVQLDTAISRAPSNIAKKIRTYSRNLINHGYTQFLYPVAMDDNYAIVGHPYFFLSNHLTASIVYFYKNVGGTLLFMDSILTGRAEAGYAVDVDAGMAVYGIPHSEGPSDNGEVRTKQFGDYPGFSTILNPGLGLGSGKRFGSSVSLDEGKLAVGAQPLSSVGFVRVYNRGQTNWEQIHELQGSSGAYGSHVVLSAGKLLVGEVGTGVNKLHIYDTETWTEELNLGTSTIYSLSLCNNFLAVGKNNFVDIYKYDGSTWGGGFPPFGATPFQTIGPTINGELISGQISVKINGEYLLIGVPNQNVNGQIHAGSIYIFKYNGATWGFAEKVTSSPLTSDMQFGFSIGGKGRSYIVGAVNGTDKIGAVASGSLY